MSRLTAVARLARGMVHVVRGLWMIVVVFPRLTPLHRAAHVQAWASRMLVILGVQITVTGSPPAAGPVLLVANHISWLDIVVMHAARHCHFVSKADVKGWPLIGTLATGAGTLYIERKARRDALRVVHYMAERLRKGDILAVFPESTTSDGVHLLPFHANLLQAAIAAQAPVQPVALKFIDHRTGALTLAPRYFGHDTLLGSIWRTLNAPAIGAVVVFGEPQQANGRSRREWANALREEVTQLRM